MAIQKQKEVFGGQADGSYWKVVQVKLSTVGKEAILNVTVNLNGDKEAADAALPALASRGYEFYLGKDQVTGDLIALSYQLIKQNDAELGSGEDV